MPKFNVRGSYTEEFTLLEVEADTEAAARLAAILLVQQGENHLVSGRCPVVDIDDVILSAEDE